MTLFQECLETIKFRFYKGVDFFERSTIDDPTMNKIFIYLLPRKKILAE